MRLANGDYATVLSKSFNLDGKEVLLPTVRKGLNRPMSDKEAIDQYKATGQHLGIFASPDEATAYSQRLHEDQATQYAHQIERRRVDDFIAQKLAERRGMAAKPQVNISQYPLPVALLGKGFMNLYDVMKGRPMAFKENK